MEERIWERSAWQGLATDPASAGQALSRPGSCTLAIMFRQVLAPFPIDPGYPALAKDPRTAPLVQNLGWRADYPDPQDSLSAYWDTGGFADERVFYTNPDLDALLDQAGGTLDPARRLDLYRQAQDLLLDDAPIAIMHHTAIRCLVTPSVRGLVATPMDYDWCGSNDPLTIRVEL